MLQKSNLQLLVICLFASMSLRGFAQNVGIGEANPLQKLHVNGNARVDNSLLLNPTTVTPNGAGEVSAAADLSMIIVLDDVTAVANTLTLMGTPVAGQVLWVKNDDADSLSFESSSLAPGELGHFMFDGTVWSKLTVGGNWALTGNVGTDPATNFLGTTDNQDLVLRTNSNERLRLTTEGFLDLTGENGNTVVGQDAGSNLTAGYDNVFLGHNAGFSNTTGFENAFSGYQAGFSNTTGPRNSFYGFQTGFNNTFGVGNTFNGFQAGFSNTTGSLNTFTGMHAGYTNTTGVYNTFTGFRAGYFNTSGTLNCFNGWLAGTENTIGFANTFSGAMAGQLNTTGSLNTFTGFQAGQANTTGIANVFLGASAGGRNITGNRNTFVGAGAGDSNTTGNDNVAIGYSADSLGNNFQCVTIGARTFANANRTNAIQIGYQSYNSSDNQVRIGNANITSIGGHVSWTAISDKRFKKDVQSNVPGLAFINLLEPVTYVFDSKPEIELLFNDAENVDSLIHATKKVWDGKRMTGFLAQDVEAAAAKIGYSFSGIDYTPSDTGKNNGYYGLRYAEFVVPLVMSVQELSEQNEKLGAENAELKARLEKLESVVQSLTESAATQD